MTETAHRTWPEALVRAYREQGYWRGETYGRVLRDRAAAHGDRQALSGGGRRLTYAELDRSASSLAAGFVNLDVRRGDRVLVQLPNVVEFVEVAFALLRLGAPPVFVPASHREAELSHFAAVTGAVAAVTAGEHAGFDHGALLRRVQAGAPELRHVVAAGDGLRAEPVELPEPQPEDLAFLAVSGGSTGRPKLVPRTHADYLYTNRATAEVCRLGAADVYLAVLPLAYNFTLRSPGVFGTLYAGGRVAVAPGPSPDVALPLLERERATITAVVPPVLRVWLDEAAQTGCDLSSLRVLQVGGARCGEELARRVRPALGCTLQQVFGMAEAVAGITRLDDPEEVVVATQGRPLSAADEVRLVGDDGTPVPDGELGNLQLRGPSVCPGYYGDPAEDAAAFTTDGFYRTGDLVRRTPGGDLVVEGRAKDQINRGGDKIAAGEVERHLLAHPAVLEAALIGVPDPFLGERSVACVIVRAEPPSAGELRSFLRARGLAAYKVPDRFQFVPAFPRTAAGKVSKPDLLREVRDGD